MYGRDLGNFTICTKESGNFGSYGKCCESFGLQRNERSRVTTELIEGKCSRGKQNEKILDGLIKWLQVGRVTDALKLKQ